MAKKRWHLFALIAVLALGAILDILYLAKKSAVEEAGINSFEECVAHNNVINLMYPAQCRTKDGRIFTQSLTDEEKKI